MLTPMADVTVDLPRAGGTREAAKKLMNSYPISSGDSVLLSARIQTVGTEDYADGLMRQLVKLGASKVVLIGHTREFAKYMRQAAMRHQFKNLKLI